MKKFLIFLIFLNFLVLSGCRFSPFKFRPMVINVIVWSEKSAIKHYPEDIKTILRSLKIALKELNFPSTLEENSNYFIFNNKIIQVKKIKEFLTEVKICWDLPEKNSDIQLIFDKIDLNLNSIEYDEQGNPSKKLKIGRLNLSRSRE